MVDSDARPRYTVTADVIENVKNIENVNNMNNVKYGKYRKRFRTLDSMYVPLSMDTYSMPPLDAAAGVACLRSSTSKIILM